MAKKSKTQRAKASAARAARKEQAREAEIAAQACNADVDAAATEAPKKRFFKKSDKDDSSAVVSKQEKVGKDTQKKVEKAPEKKPAKKRRFGFFKDVRTELKRVTWPTKQDVLHWSVVVVAALVFFGVFVGLLDNVIITPLLIAISGLGA